MSKPVKLSYISRFARCLPDASPTNPSSGRSIEVRVHEFSHTPGKTQCYSKQEKERVLLGVKKPREETQKCDSQQAIRLKFPEYRTCSPGDMDRSGRGDVLNRSCDISIQLTPYDRLGMLCA